jgi:ABC-2 type transport system ATP-binding protein
MTDISNTSLVTVERLNVWYGSTHAVRDLSFEIPKGEIFGFIGPNGAGKTSTFKVLSTLLKPHPASGRVSIAGVDVLRNPQKIRKLIGYAPDFFGVYDDLTVREYLHFFAAAYRLSHGEREATVRDVLALTDLSEKVDAPVDGLSRGMKQRLSIARLLLHDPQLLILDEPASGLDPRARIEMRELLKELQSMGKTILISSHILHELAQLCTRIGILEAGEWVADGSLEEIFQTLDLQRVVHVQVGNPSEALLDGVRQLPAVVQVDEDPDRWAIHVNESLSSIEDLHEAIHDLGARIRMFQPQAMDMETVFMKLTEGKTA